MKAKRFLFFLICISSILAFQIEESKLGKLPKELREISGLELASAASLYAINDGGHEPLVYEIDFKGKILRSVRLKNVKNIDWEDITTDESEQNLYIGDFGNNLNNRTNLCVYRVKIQDIKTKDEVDAEIIPFAYTEQKDFPPNTKYRRFDCEAMCAVGTDQLLLFTKNNTKPYDGICSVYSLNLENSKVNLISEIKIGKNGYFHNSVTAADFYKTDANKQTFYLSTYSSMYIYEFSAGKFNLKNKISYKTFTQKESLVVKSENEIFVADERSPLGTGGNLHKIQLLHAKHK